MSKWNRWIPRAVVAAAMLTGGDRISAQSQNTVTGAPVETLDGKLISPPTVVATPTAPAPAPVATVPAPTVTVAEPAAILAAGGCPSCGDTGCVTCQPFNFKKVPPNRPAPRPGAFPIPPSGKGAYTLLTELRGGQTDGPPKSGYAPIGLMPPSFFDSDFRYLEDPKTPPKDASDRMKRMKIGDDFMLSLGGSAWSRYMNEYNSRLTQRDNVYQLSRARIYSDLWYQDKLRFYIEGIASYTQFQDLPPLAIDETGPDFLNLFIDAKVAEVGGNPVYLRVGRQEVSLGSQRLISNLEWGNTRRTFQGFRLMQTTEKWDTDLFWVQPVIPNTNKLDSGDNNVNFAGAWATYKPKKGTTVDMYYLMLDNTNRVTQQGINRQPSTVHTLGGRYAGDTNGEFLWDAELALQLGRQGKQDIVAGMVTTGLGYHSKTLPWNPTLWAYYDYASGDDNPNSGRYNTFNQLFPFGHYYMGWVDLVGRQNIHDVNFHLYVYPAKWLTCWVQVHNFWLDSGRDALYNVGGNATRRDPTGRAGTFVGNEIDLVTNFHLTPRSDLLVGYSHLFGGGFLRNTSGPNASVNSSLFYMQYGVRW